MFLLTDPKGTRKRSFATLWRVLCLALCLALLCTTLPATEAPVVYANETLDELNAEKDALAQKEEELAAQRAEVAATLEEQKAQNAILLQQIDTKSAEIGVNEQMIAQLQTQIADKNARIAEQESTIASLEKSITETYTLLQKRLRELAKENTFSTILQMLLDSKSYNDYLISFKVSERISARDQKMMDDLEADMLAVEQTRNQNLNDKAALEIELTQLEGVQKDMETAKGELQALYAEKVALEAQMAANIEYLDQQISELQSQQEYLQSTIDDVMEQIRLEEERRRQEEEERRRQEEEAANRDEANDSDGDEGDDPYYEDTYTPPTAGSMVWPAPTCRVVTSSYGWRESFGAYHKGLDIARYGYAGGHEIVAAADGVVRYANRYDTWGGGYGLFMIIDHGYDENGQRIMTVYAHCEEVLVYEGLEVSAGETIGYIGNTGDSYGAHLHFEVQADGVAVDPADYLPMDWIDILG